MGKAKTSLSFLLVLIFIGVAGVGAFFLLKDLEGPKVTVSPDNQGRIGPNQELRVTMEDPSGIRSVQVVVRRNDQSMTVLRQEFSPVISQQELTFTLKETNLPEGAFDLEVKANDGSYAGFGKGNSTTLTLRMRMDTQPPRIAVKTVPPSIRRGGVALIMYTVSEEVSMTGVKVAEHFFPGYRQPSGAYACLFPFPYFITTADYYPQIMAEDLAGNVTSSRLLVNANNKNFKSDTMRIDDNFLNAKASELDAMCPGKETLIEQYVCVNNGERVANDEFLLELGGDSSPVFLWSGNFQRLPRSAVQASFGDFRTYTYNGEKIDEQTHTGLDLASVRQAEVPASNAGLVIYADVLGIYGNLVVIDHGIGLMSVYSHLTELRVKEGDIVSTGQIVGTTGTTGLAGGDHVHFGFLVGGVPVEPLEWLDPNWVRNNITTRLNTDIQ